MATASASFVIRACKCSILRFCSSMSRFSIRSNSALILVRKFATVIFSCAVLQA